MNYLVFDVGGSAIKYALMNQKAEFLEKGQVPTPQDTIENFVNAIGGIFDKYKDRIEGIAISMPGRIDSDRGYAYSGGHLKYNYDKDICSILQKRCPVPITIENDGKCAALAEAWIGSLSDCNDAIVVIIGTGIGGGIIKDKKLHKGPHFTAGEFSYIITNDIDTEGEVSKSLWGYEGGYLGLIKPVSERKNIPIEKLDGRKVFEMANNGDKDVLQILDSYCYKLVRQLFNLQYIYDPEKIAIGGGISSQDILMEYIQKNIEKLANSLPHNIVIPEVVRCKFRNDSNLIGALYHYLNKR
ncbi:Sugar kinase of the NBD/HSP70 family, may contain an N-terminal HTH domain [Clostridium sp. USBA 49]|uniref:ROK family protein n=1 Tax=Clostridium sp. USBA 49 TaxID=1881060 RepID=UPI00099A9E0B|nr:ROK family protein [Clostridium sp. USBA 49]SKA73829.1 Sugar kinase of the NBD/HSP70 family, may contain an N-terminal HTH domain [Clostridium sp. USBA 49]